MVDLYTLKDEYIAYLKEYDSRILDNIKNNSDRKYIGFLFMIDDFKYIAPLSSAKKGKDYIIIGYSSNGGEYHRLLLPEYTRPVIRIISRYKNGNVRVLAKILLNNMIPIGNNTDEYAVKYDVSKETDLKYKDLILMELRYINKNYSRIVKSAKTIYDLKVNGHNEYGFIKKATYDFKMLEEKCIQYKGNHFKGCIKV